MKTMKLFFMASLFGFACMNLVAMQDDERPPVVQAAPVHTAPAVQANPADSIRTLQAAFAESQACLRQLVTNYNPELHLREGVRLAYEHRPVEVIHSTITAIKDQLTDLAQQNAPHTAPERQAAIHTVTAIADQLHELPTEVDRIFDATHPIANRHLEYLTAINHAIDQIHNYFDQYTPQNVEDEQHPPLTNNDRNLAREIDAFFQLTRQRLNLSHRSIQETIKNIRALSGEINTVEQTLERIIRTEQQVAAAIETNQNLPAQDQAPAAAADQPQASFTRRALATGWAAVSATASILTKPKKERQAWGTQKMKAAASTTTTFMRNTVIPQAQLFIESALPNSLTEEQIPQTLMVAKEQLEIVLTHLQEKLQALRTAVTTENAMINNVKVLCKALNTRGNPYFNLPQQDRVESSLATTILSSTARTYAIRALLSYCAQPKQPKGQGENRPAMPIIPLPRLMTLLNSLYPEAAPQPATQLPQPINPQEGIDPRPLCAAKMYSQAQEKLSAALQGSTHKVRNTLEHYAPELPNILKQERTQPVAPQDPTQPEAKQSFDDFYTGALIRTEDPNFLLYDIAARTRFNTGRFSYLIRPLVHKIEEFAQEKQESPHQVTPDGEEDNEKRPGQMYNGIMRALASKSTPLEHPWLLFFKPAPYAIRLLEGVLRTADPSLPPAYSHQTQEPEPVQLRTQEPFTSTSFESFTWGGLKRLVQGPTQHIVNIASHQFTKTIVEPARQVGRFAYEIISPLANYLKEGAQSLKESFIGTRLGAAIHNKITATYTKIPTAQDIASRTRSLLIWFNMEKSIKNLERSIREGHPASESIAQIQAAVANHRLEWGTDTLVAAIAHNHQKIRAFAKKYKGIQRLDPITQETITNDRLRTTLGSFVQGLNAQPTAMQ